MSLEIFINVRDRLTDLAQLVEWLERAGHERITLLDNESSYPPLLEYLERTPHNVIRLGVNAGSRSLWIADMVPRREFFVFTDPDIVPHEDCPTDAIARLRELLDLHPHPKAALGLYLDDVPPFQSLSHERRLIAAHREVRQGVFDTQSDTTLAVYRPGVRYTLTALRTAFPYVARHLPWYHLDSPSKEERYYLDRAIKGPTGSSWADGRQ